MWIAIIIAVIGLVAWGVSYYSKDTVAKPSSVSGPQGVPVEAGPVQVGPISREAETVGTLEANESVVIRSEIAGRITGIEFSEGQTVQGGAVLLRIDPSEHKAQAEQISATVQLNRLNYERAQKLNEEKLISPQAYDEIVARLKESEANLALAQARLDKTTIRAPFSGRLGLRQVSPGDYVQPGQAIVNLEDIHSIKVDLRVPEIYLPEVRAGQVVKVRVDAAPDRFFTGKIYAVDPRIDTASRTILLRARIPNPGGELRPGMFARLTLVLGERPNAILIPEQAIVPLGEAKFVYRIVDGKAVLAKVTVGLRQPGRVEITEGLRPDDTIVTGGQTKLFEGASVMVIEASAAKTEPPAPAKP